MFVFFFICLFCVAFLINTMVYTRCWMFAHRMWYCHRHIHRLNVCGVRSVIATGVASQQHSIWRTDGYQWWNALGRECVAKVVRFINRRLLSQFFDIWWIMTGVSRANSYNALVNARCRARGGGRWLAHSPSWWKWPSRWLCGVVFGPSSSWEVAFRWNDNDSDISSSLTGSSSPGAPRT